MTKTLLIASSNQGKLAEINAILAPLDFNVLPQSEFAVSDAEETGLTFVENALLKARHAANHCSYPVIADDSGLEVPALNGAPGIYSARYAGEHGNDKANNQKLIKELEGLDDDQRNANFRCVMVYLCHPEDPVPIIAEGVWRGTILHAERGSGGFGYDPLFFVPQLGKTGAELEAAHKNRISHRGQALSELTRRLAATSKV